MATKLKNLKITKVDFVDQGANPDAHILLFKRKDKTKTEGGTEYPAEAYAYVPDPEKPSTWKLRLWEDTEKKETAAQVARAIQAISPSGFRGNQVQIPDADMPTVKDKIKAAWLKTHPDASEDEMPEVLKKGANAESMNWFEKIGKAIADAIGIKSPEDINKNASTFEDEKRKVDINRMIDENWWDYISALRESLENILSDETLSNTEKEQMITESLNEFTKALHDTLINPDMQVSIETAVTKVGRKISSDRLERMKNMRDMLDSLIQEVESDQSNNDNSDITKSKPKTNVEKGEDVDMKIDKSKLTPEELATLKEIEKKAGIQDESAPSDVNKSAGNSAEEPTEEDIYKGLHPAVKAELERLRKAADEAEERELNEIAKKYEIIGKKPDELVPMFKNLKAAGGNAYEQMIAILDASVEAVKKSGLFSEVGKRGNGESDAWTAIEKHADEIQKSMPNLTRAQAITKACEQHPELVHEYENSR